MKRVIEGVGYPVLVLLGWAGVVAGWVMISGQEELTRWSTHAISNGTAMFFAVSLGFLVLMEFLASRASNKKTRYWLKLAGLLGAVTLMGIMSIATPFGL